MDSRRYRETLAILKLMRMRGRGTTSAKGAKGRRGKKIHNRSLADERELIPTVAESTSRESGQEQL
jgi:hypothetical protein